MSGHPPSSALLDALSSVAPEHMGGEGSEFLGRTASRSRIHIAYTILALVVLALVVRASALQLVSGSGFRTLADRNRTRTELLVPTRGVITDRAGVPLVVTVVRYAVAIVPADLPRGADRAARVRALAGTLDLPEDALAGTLARYAPSLTEPIAIRDGLAYDAALPYLLRAPQEPALRLLVREQREYRTSDGQSLESMSHVVGYVGRVSAEEYAEVSTRQYRPSDLIGKTGIEAAAEAELRGTAGIRTTTVDVLGRIVATAAVDPPVAGVTLVTTLDRELQAVAERALREGAAPYSRRGAAVVLDADTGELLALVSMPGFSATAFASGIPAAEYRRLTEDPNHPLFPRAVAGMYPSGSTIKPVVAAAALAERVITPTTRIRSTGGFSIGRASFPDWKAGGHGVVDVRRALAESVNTFFYVVGGGWPNEMTTAPITPLGPERIAAGFRAFGFGSPTGVDLPSEASGLVPTPEWKQRERRVPWYIGDTYHLAIGQGDLLVTPLQLARATAAIANGGTLITPHLVHERRDASGRPIAYARAPDAALDPAVRDALRTVRAGMRDAVTAGSAAALADLPMFVAGKTGTAQHDPNRLPHAWFAGFAERDDARVAITVLVEEGGEGSRTAVPVAKRILAWWASHQTP